MTKQSRVVTNSIGMSLKRISSGGIQHSDVQVPFLIGVYEVTFRDWYAVMPRPEAPDREGITADPAAALRAVDMLRDTRPVLLRWRQAEEFCRRLSAMPSEQAAGRVYRLPTSAEWEYACRAGTTTRYSFGDDEKQLAEYAWFRANSGGVVHHVGQKRPNPWGLFDMHGNAREWVSDWVTYKEKSLQADKDNKFSHGGDAWSLEFECAASKKASFGHVEQGVDLFWEGGFRVAFTAADNRLVEVRRDFVLEDR